MSCVAPLKAITAKRAMEMLKKCGRFRENATNPKVTPVRSWVAITKNFFVLNNSRKGLHKGFNVHGSKIKEVQNVISLSSTPNPLNINTVTILRNTNGSPIAKYAVGIHDMGLTL